MQAGKYSYYTNYLSSLVNTVITQTIYAQQILNRAHMHGKQIVAPLSRLSCKWWRQWQICRVQSANRTIQLVYSSLKLRSFLCVLAA